MYPSFSVSEYSYNVNSAPESFLLSFPSFTTVNLTFADVTESPFVSKFDLISFFMLPSPAPTIAVYLIVTVLPA